VDVGLGETPLLRLGNVEARKTARTQNPRLRE
jgi:hypothetical protein